MGRKQPVRQTGCVFKKVTKVPTGKQMLPRVPRVRVGVDVRVYAVEGHQSKFCVTVCICFLTLSYVLSVWGQLIFFSIFIFYA